MAVRQGGWDGQVRLSTTIIPDTDWWLAELSHNQPASLLQPAPQVTLYTDAGPFGWGAHAFLHPPPPVPQSHIFLQGRWHNLTQTSNYHELDAARQALRLLLLQPHLPPVHSVIVRSDNTVTCYNINRQAAGPNLRLPLLLLLKFVRQHHIFLRARHIPVLANDAADRLSRFSASGDYAVNKLLLQTVLARLKLTITADLFATSRNKQHPVYYTMRPDRAAAKQDAFSIPWRNFSLPLIHPPIPLIPKVL
jgi:hypothetical protein